MFIGVSKERLVRKPVYVADYKGKFLSISKVNRLSWTNCIGDVKMNPAFEPNPHMIIVGMSGFGKSAGYYADRL